MKDYTFRTVYPDVSAAVAVAIAPHKPRAWKSAQHDLSSVMSPDGWAGGSLDDAFRLQETGWSERPQLQGLADQIKIEGTAIMPTVRHAVSGSMIDMGEFLAGMPECMLEFVEEPAPRIVKVGFNLFAPSSVDASTVARRGAVILATTDALLANGFGVELVVFVAACYQGDLSKTHYLEFTLKQSNQYLDLDALAFWSCHPMAFRRLGFALVEHEPRAVRKTMGYHKGGSYGRVFKPSKEATGLDIIISPDLHQGRECGSMPAAVDYFNRIMEGFTG